MTTIGVVGAILAGGSLALSAPFGLSLVAASSVVTDSSVIVTSPDPGTVSSPTPVGAGAGLPSTASAQAERVAEAVTGLVVLLVFVSGLSIYLRRRLRNTPRT